MHYFLAGDRRSDWLAPDPVHLCLVKCSYPVRPRGDGPHGEGEESKKLALASVSIKIGTSQKKIIKIGSVSVDVRTPVSGQIISTFSLQLQACSNLQHRLFIRKGASLTCRGLA
jgi:hypothetical protein